MRDRRESEPSRCVRRQLAAEGNLMSHRLRWVAAALAATIVFAAGLTTALPNAQATSPAPAVGAQFQRTWPAYRDAQRTAMLDKLQAAGVMWVRIHVGWPSFGQVVRGS